MKETDISPRRWSRKMKLVVGITVSALMSFVVIVFLFMTCSGVEVEYRRSEVKVDQPIEITLTQRLLAIDTTSIAISPKITGSWTVQRSFPGKDRLVFTHPQPLTAGTTYTVGIPKASRFYGARASVPVSTFATESAPGVENVSFQAGKDIAADATLNVTLSAANRNLRDLQLITVPNIKFTRSTTDDTTFSWKPTGLLPQGKSLKVEIKDIKSGKTLLKQALKVAAEPRVAKKVKPAYFAKTDVATIEFSQPIDKNSGTPAFDLGGEGEWKNDTTYQFTPTLVAPGRVYHYTIPKGLRSLQGGVVTKTQKYQFSTPGIVRVTSMSPYGQELSQAQQVVRFTFDQPVDHASAEARAHISQGTIVSRVWEGRTLALTVQRLGVQRTVHAWVDRGVRPIFGLPSTASFNLSFTTEIPVKKLNAPQYYQQYAQSCEASSVRMALAYKGIHIGNDMTIVKKFGYNPHPYDKMHNVWDDPQLQFVGDINGSQAKMTGWGVYAGPVANAIQGYGRGAIVQYGVSTGFVANQIYAGNPVVLWGVWNESATQKSWKTPTGRKVTGPIPMHVRLVVGVKGKASSPIGFYINDPINGTLYWTAAELAHNLAQAGAANQAVAVQ